DATFDKAKADIKKALVQEKTQDAQFMNDLMMKEIKKADVKVDDKDLKDLFKEQKADDKKDEKK
ncbi:peptidylprolyl isomerase PrsA, partial [Bacillus cereus]|nr:peptidylprolyl isomerase PrsA [Bacillus cereus]